MSFPWRIRIEWLFIAALMLVNPAWAQGNACLKRVKPLETSIKPVSQMGGVWSLFERSQPLREHSVSAIQLDSKINRLMTLLKYLCNTLEGIPLNDLARYVKKNVDAKGEVQFRKELDILGKSKFEVDQWFVFLKFSREHAHRKLDKNSVRETIRRAKPFFDRYVRFAQEIQTAPRKKQAHQAESFTQDINAFLTSDQNTAQAMEETAQVPYWDFDENHGGS